MQTLDIDLTKRPRRNRKSAAVRALVQETHLQPSNFVAPLFILDGPTQKQAIHSMPEVERLSIDLAVQEVKKLYVLGVRAVDIFPVIAPNLKDENASAAIAPNNLAQRSVQAIKEAVPEICVMVDVALDPFTDHGHDGIVNAKGDIDNDATLEVLGQMSLLAAEAGVDVIAPSDMMDGRVAYLRKLLDSEGFHHVSILSYAAKYASSFYGPFRDALQSAPKFGDKKTYQMNPANSREALLECALDEAEGADMLLIKPALAYLDILAKVRQQTHLPIGAYHVSGEYAMVMAAAQNGWIDADRVFMESFLSIKRAGADFIFTYASHRIAKLLQ